MPASILFIFTSADKTLTGKPTGYYLPEAAHPYYILAPHYNITFASPAGPNPPVDAGSVEAFKGDEDSVKFLQDETVMQKLAKAITLHEVKVSDYDAIFYPGGHGPLMDLSTDPVNAKIVEEAVHEKKVVSAVCHGPAALVSAQIKHLVHKRSIFHGKNVTGFSNAEEEIGGMTKDVPFLLEDRIIELGGKFSKAAEPWAVHVVVDGDLITGQNPASSKAVAEAIHTRLQEREKSAALSQGVEMEGAQGGRLPTI